MYASNIAQLQLRMQYPMKTQDVIFYDDGTIFCPMCEDKHENNSMCQMPMEGF